MEKDVKGMIEDIVKKVKADPQFMEEFKADPVKTLEKTAGIDLPDGMIEPLIAGVKAHMETGEIGDVIGKLEGLFGRKG